MVRVQWDVAHLNGRTEKIEYGQAAPYVARYGHDLPTLRLSAAVFWVVDNGPHTAAGPRQRGSLSFQRDHDPPAGACVLAQPDRNLLLRHPAKAAYPRRLS